MKVYLDRRVDLEGEPLQVFCHKWGHEPIKVLVYRDEDLPKLVGYLQEAAKGLQGILDTTGRYDPLPLSHG